MNGLELSLFGVAVAFAAVMGGTGLAPSFAVTLGANIVPRRVAVALYASSVLAGSLLFGGSVAKTLSGGIVPEAVLTPARVLCVFGAAFASLLFATLLRVPQSTSWVTVLSLVMVGLHTSRLRAATLFARILPAWIGLPVLAFGLTYLGMRAFYPLRPGNFRAHELLARHEGRLKWMVLGTSSYVAVAIGANNVPNAVGPLSAAGVIGVKAGFAVFAPLFGLGAVLFPEPARTVGNGIVPIGVLAATLVSFVVGSLLLTASWLGIPQSLVQLNAAAVMAVWRVKEDARSASEHPTLRRLLGLWLVTPVIAALLTAFALRVSE